MNGKDLDSLGTALAFFRNAVDGLAASVEAVAAARAEGGREVTAEGWAPPAWAPPGRFVARDRLLDVGKIVVARVVIGWTAPDLETVAGVDLDDRALQQEFDQARTAFIEAAGRVAVEVAVHGDVYPRHLEDGTAWRRVAPGAWPAEAAALVPDVQVALTRWSVAWLALAGRLDGASFLPRRAA